jgi:hypothetical protein
MIFERIWVLGSFLIRLVKAAVSVAPDYTDTTGGLLRKNEGPYQANIRRWIFLLKANGKNKRFCRFRQTE